MTVRVWAPSRLHFGLMAAGRASRRQFGGAGLMIDQPCLSLRARLADRLLVNGDAPTAILTRARGLLDRLAVDVGDDVGKVHLTIHSAPPEHVGLGVGTQLSLAVTAAVCRLLGRDANPSEWARLASRGRRSGIGVHGFASGGFLVDGGKGPASMLAPLVARHDFPASWPVVLARPSAPAGLAGDREEAAFAACAEIPLDVSRELARLLLLGVLPGIAERDYPAFAEALFEFNRVAGECFAVAQGGTYATDTIARAVTALRAEGIRAAGQSSWGPTVYAIASDGARAERAKAVLATELGVEPMDVVITGACNSGARIVTEEE